jgi:Divergent InlB B-repeat domain
MTHKTLNLIGGRRARLAAVAALALSTIAPLAMAQTATIYGSVYNFDIINNTGVEACGFEMVIEGLPFDSATYTYSGSRYGASVLTPYSNGVVTGTRVTWKSSNCSATHTVPHALNTPFAGTCYGTGDSGCDHFGVSATFSSTSKVTARWLVRDPLNATTLVAHDPPMAVPMTYYYVAPGGVNGAPVVVDVVEAPEPPETPEVYGNAQWMKVFVRQMPRTVTLDELVSTNPLVVPMAATQLEFNWKLVQADPLVGGGRRNRGRHQGSNTLDPTTRAVVRRYEMYAYNGTYDPVTHEALCADVLCNVPGATEIGDFISAQMTAVNVQGDFISVGKAGTGGGNVDSSDKRIACGSKCSAPYAAGSVVTLTAKANSGSSFAGWTGACNGTASTCSVTVNGANTATANFNLPVVGGGGGGTGGGGGGTAPGNFALSVSLGNPGSVKSSPAGINCGATCSANYAVGTVVTLTAAPPTGLAFTGWSGACSAVVGPVCSVTMSKAQSVKANFTK